MSSANQIKAEVTHRFRVPPDKVFAAWVTRDLIPKWFAPGLGEMVRVIVDPKEGGIFSFVQRRGMDNVEHNGKYVEFIRPERLVFTWSVKGTGHDSRVVIDIAPVAGGSELHLVHELHPHWENYRERTAASWTKMLTAMAEAIE